MKIKSIFVALVFPFFGLQATLPCDVYLGGWGAVQWLQDDLSEVDIEYKVGFGEGIVLGTEWNENWHLELEFSYHKNGIKDLKVDGNAFGITGKITQKTLFANLIYLYPITCSTRLLVGGGVGWKHDHAVLSGISLPKVQNSDSDVTGQFICGLAHEGINSRFEYFVQYRYLPFDEDFSSHLLVFGINYYVPIFESY